MFKIFLYRRVVNSSSMVLATCFLKEYALFLSHIER